MTRGTINTSQDDQEEERIPLKNLGNVDVETGREGENQADHSRRRQCCGKRTGIGIAIIALCLISGGLIGIALSSGFGCSKQSIEIFFDGRVATPLESPTEADTGYAKKESSNIETKRTTSSTLSNFDALSKSTAVFEENTGLGFFDQAKCGLSPEVKFVKDYFSEEYVDFEPKLVEVQQCNSRFPCSDGNSCSSAATKNVTRLVKTTHKNGSEIVQELTLSFDTSCSCQCNRSPEDCSGNFFLDPEKCQCLCNPLHCENPKTYFDYKTCTCKCLEKHDGICSTNYRRNPITCECEWDKTQFEDPVHINKKE